jgi:hypothetical protein
LGVHRLFLDAAIPLCGLVRNFDAENGNDKQSHHSAFVATVSQQQPQL